MEKLTLLKYLHTCLKLPILVFNEQTNIINEYRSEQMPILFYNYEGVIKDLFTSSSLFKFINGPFNEMLLGYKFNDLAFIIGPFRCNVFSKNFLESKMEKHNVQLEEQHILYSHLTKLPLYSLGDIRDILILVHYFFTNEQVDLLSQSLHSYVTKLSIDIKKYKIQSLIDQNYDPNIYLFLYEEKILEYVKAGKTEDLKKIVFEISKEVIPSISGDSMRREKNYSILVFEKLSQVAINMGMDIIHAYQNRDYFIAESEKEISLESILKVRDAAIVFFTAEIVKNKSKKLSPLVSSIIQYINLNKYKPLKVKEIAKYFRISETTLRNLFKNEMNMSVQNYITKQKISEAKIMLQSNYTINDIAFSLGFADSSHFSRVFKKFVGITPKKYQYSSD